MSTRSVLWRVSILTSSITAWCIQFTWVSCTMWMVGVFCASPPLIFLDFGLQIIRIHTNYIILWLYYLFGFFLDHFYLAIITIYPAPSCTHRPVLIVWVLHCWCLSAGGGCALQVCQVKTQLDCACIDFVFLGDHPLVIWLDVLTWNLHTSLWMN